LTNLLTTSQRIRLTISSTADYQRAIGGPTDRSDHLDADSTNNRNTVLVSSITRATP
jgi:hypothetical protein